MTKSRREFVSQLASAAALAAAGIAARPKFLSAIGSHPRAGDPVLKELCAAALNAAKSAGATYADVRFTVTRSENMVVRSPHSWQLLENTEHGAVGVRSLVDGAWGFAASNVWSADEAARLARASVTQARASARGRRRRAELGDPPRVASGEWTAPIKRDPFTVPLAEKLDALWALTDAVTRLNAPVSLFASAGVSHRRQEKTFSSTDGLYLTQTTYHSHPGFGIGALDDRNRTASRSMDLLQPAAAGWELVTDGRYFEHIPALAEEVQMMLDTEPVDPDRYDIVCDGFTTARLAGLTIGVAAELDRVLGYEANAGGTSYLPPPDEALGKLTLGPAYLNVTANRSQRGVIGTVKWDDEGVEPSEYSIIKGGVLANYHTTREFAARGQTSRGCAGAENAGAVTLIHTPHVVMHPGSSDVGFEELVADLEHGLVVVGGAVSTDRQQLNGEINASQVYEVRKGKRTRFLRNTEVLFRSPELWKGLQQIGGARSQVWTAMTGFKGQPEQQQHFSVAGVPARFARVPVTDRTRQA